MLFVSFLTIIILFGAWTMPPLFGTRATRAMAGAGLGIPGLLMFVTTGATGPDGAAFAMFAAMIAFFAWVASWLYEPALRAYYHLTPHPAAEAIEEAIYGGEQLDASIASALRSVGPTGDRIYDEVLAEQARSLATRAHDTRARLAREEAHIMAEEAARLQKANELARAQRDLAEAALAYEKQAARLAELKRES